MTSDWAMLCLCHRQADWVPDGKFLLLSGPVDFHKLQTPGSLPLEQDLQR